MASPKFSALDRRHSLAPYQHLIGKIERAASVDVQLVHFDDDEDFGTGWFASATKEGRETATGYQAVPVASEWGDGPFIALDKLAAKLGVTVDADDLPKAEPLTAPVVAGSVRLSDAVREAQMDGVA